MGGDAPGNSASNIGQNNSFHSQGTITCPPASYAYGTNGQSGKSVDSITGLNCRNIYSGQTNTVTSGGFGGGGGKSSTKPIDCGGDGLTGFWTFTRNNDNLDGLGGICRSLGNDSRRDVGLDGTSGDNWHRFADANHLITSVTGATSSNNVVSNFGYNTLDFNAIRNFAAGNNQSGAACCAGQDGSAECSSARNGGLNCQSALQSWCSQGDRIYSDGTCQAAMGNGSLDGTWARNQQLAWCQQGSNFNSDNCKSFCTAHTGTDSAQKNACDTLYQTQCSQPANKTLDICSCSLSWSDYPAAATALINKITGAPQEPMCYFSQCKNSGYWKTTPDKLACPACIQSQNIDIANATANLNNISQSCNVSTATSTSSAAANTNAASTPTGGTTTSTTGSSSVTTPAPATSTTTTATPATTSTAAKASVSTGTSPLVFVGAGIAGFIVLFVIATAATHK